MMIYANELEFVGYIILPDMRSRLKGRDFKIVGVRNTMIVINI